MYNSGKGVRSYTLGALKTVFSSNAGSFWDLNAVNGTTTYTDAISSRTLTRAVAQNSVVPTGPDADSSITFSSGVVTGGANIGLRLKRGDKFVGPFSTLRRNIVVGDYGSGASVPRADLCAGLARIDRSWHGRRVRPCNQQAGRL
jgi:hypothetical protein